jgi:2-polyprenyl-6-methoxyphenol hydroxylase-like FAD-dependent oxidoreductase
MNLRPIEILGGGLAGLSLGIALRREGVPVTLHEAGDYPRHRVCGEFITGLKTSTIERLGLRPHLRDALEHHDVAWSIAGESPHIQRLPAPALGISRHSLDARIARTFVDTGGVLRLRSRVMDDENVPGRIFATGRRRAAKPRWIGLKVHVRDLTLTRDLEMHLGEQCYVGLSRIEDRKVNVCGLFRRRALTGRGPGLLIAYIRAAGLDALAGRLTSAVRDPESFCAVAALDFDRRVNVTDRICLGDANAMIPPFTGNGMAMAFQSAEIALPHLLAYARGETEWLRICRATNRALRGRFRMRLASADALHPFLLHRGAQRCFAALSRARLIPFRPLYASLH